MQGRVEEKMTVAIRKCLEERHQRDGCVTAPDVGRRSILYRSWATFLNAVHCCGWPYHCIQNPRWTQKLCIPVFLHTIFGSDYYVPP